MKETGNIEVLKQKLLSAAGKYSDYRRYCDILADLNEEYDETLENYNLDIWYGKSKGTICEKAAHMLAVTGDLFYDMVSNAEKELFSVIGEIMECGREEQKLIWERDLFLDKTKITEENLKEYLVEWDEYLYVPGETRQEAARDKFIDIIEGWKQHV